MRVLIVMTLFVLVCSPVLAQDDSDAKYGERDGRGALLFLFDELNLDSFAGGVGGKYWLSDVWAMNASLRFRNDGSTHDGPNTGTSDNTATSVGFTTAIERHLVRARLSPYVGASIGYLYTYRKSTRAQGSSSSETKTTSHQGMAALSVGVEFWLTRNLSLAGQYDLGVSYTTEIDSARNAGDPGTYEWGNDLWTTNLSAGSLILGIYF